MINVIFINRVLNIGVEISGYIVEGSTSYFWESSLISALELDQLTAPKYSFTK